MGEMYSIFNFSVGKWALAIMTSYFLLNDLCAGQCSVTAHVFSPSIYCLQTVPFLFTCRCKLSFLDCLINSNNNRLLWENYAAIIELRRQPLHASNGRKCSSFCIIIIIIICARGNRCVILVC